MDCKCESCLLNEIHIHDLLQIIGSILGFLGLVAIGVGVGVAVSRHNSNNSTTNSPSNSSSGSGTLINGTDPSQFEKDPNLFISFYGIAYSPANVQLPDCGATLGRFNFSSSM